MHDIVSPGPFKFILRIDKSPKQCQNLSGERQWFVERHSGKSRRDDEREKSREGNEDRIASKVSLEQ